MLDQEAIHAALFARLKSEVAVKFATRDWIEPSALASVNRQPALEYSVEGDTDISAPEMPPVLVMTAEVILYVLNNSSAYEATKQVLDLVSQIRGAVTAHRGEDGRRYYTTLGGLVEWAKVKRVEIVEGHVTGQAAAIVTIEMRAEEDG